MTWAGDFVSANKRARETPAAKFHKAAKKRDKQTRAQRLFQIYMHLWVRKARADKRDYIG